jgi:hypothetical protein
VPAQMSAETLVEIIDVRHVGIGEQRHGAGRLHHIHQDQVLMGHEFDAADKAFGQCRIIQRGEENNERPPPQPQPDEAAHFIVVGVDAARRRSSVASRSRDIRMTGGSSSLISANVPRASATSARTRRINPPIRLSETASAAGYTAPMTDEGSATTANQKSSRSRGTIIAARQFAAGCSESLRKRTVPRPRIRAGGSAGARAQASPSS